LSLAAGDGLLAAVFAAPCAACDGPLERPAASAVCDACWSSIARWTPPTCAICGDALPSWRVASVSAGRCPRCRRTAWAVDRHASIGPYQDRLRDILHAFKYTRLRTLAPGIAALMREAGRDLLAGADAAVPVPLHRARRRQRGFNQASDLASGLGLQVIHALRRARATAPQVSLASGRRHANVRGAFVLAPRPLLRAEGWTASLGRGARLTATARLVAGRRLVLVDDVCTTGATLHACAHALKAAGAAEVRAITAARAVAARRP
jgi:predicted amidophosphoribosyltransferase